MLPELLEPLAKRLDPASPLPMVRGNWSFLETETDEQAKLDVSAAESVAVAEQEDVAAGRDPAAGRIVRDAMAFLRQEELHPGRHFPDLMSDYILDVGTDDLWSAA